MGFFDNGFKVGTGVAVGIGAVIVAPALIPALAGVAKPLAKATIKGSLLLYEKGREVFAEAAEVVEDLAAEAKAELAEQRSEIQSVGPSQETEPEA